MWISLQHLVHICKDIPKVGADQVAPDYDDGQDTLEAEAVNAQVDPEEPEDHTATYIANIEDAIKPNNQSDALEDDSINNVKGPVMSVQLQENIPFMQHTRKNKVVHYLQL